MADGLFPSTTTQPLGRERQQERKAHEPRDLGPSVPAIGRTQISLTDAFRLSERAAALISVTEREEYSHGSIRPARTAIEHRDGDDTAAPGTDKHRGAG
jgi:hypothetical protein